jgi:endonuclease VIII
MPEGDTIHLTAARLRDALGTGPLIRFETPRPVPGPRPASGASIEEIIARGKHLLVTFSDGVTLHTHMQMTGSWRTFVMGEPRRVPPSRIRVMIETPRAAALCLAAPVVELLDRGALRGHPILNALGPDLCDPSPDLDEALAHLDRLDPSTPVGVALLDQRVAAGIGNVYRAEVLWLCSQDPFAPLADVSPEQRRTLLDTAHAQLRRNLRPGPRRTVPEGLAVYDRAGRPCRRCSDRIEVRRLGEQARAVWWCVACQTER